MDWERYRQLADQPQVLTRWLLVQSAELMVAAQRCDLAKLLNEAAAGPVLEKPADFRGGPPTDLFRVELSATDVADVLAVVEAAVAADQRTSATVRRGLGGFAEAWRELHQFLTA